MKVGREIDVVNKPVIAMVLSLIAGIFAFINGFIRLVYIFFGLKAMSLFGSFGEYMAANESFGVLTSSLRAPVFAFADLVAGLVIVITALMLDSRPRESRKCGAIVLILSTYNFLGGSLTGLHIAGVLGFVGGAIAILWKSQLS